MTHSTKSITDTQDQLMKKVKSLEKGSQGKQSWPSAVTLIVTWLALDYSFACMTGQRMLSVKALEGLLTLVIGGFGN